METLPAGESPGGGRGGSRSGRGCRDVDAASGRASRPGEGSPKLSGDAAGGAGDDTASRTLLRVVTDWAGHYPNGAASVAALVAAGADVNACFVGEHAETPLHWAASTDDVEVLDALLMSGRTSTPKAAPSAAAAGRRCSTRPCSGSGRPRAAWSSVALRPDRGRKPVWAWSTPSLAARAG